ncbi:hypothetical protein [Paenibacillus terrae]|uniref:hypothetical protein n=1 Tax=Paenibacillus terrae TaxID=159743 RepID=UPI00165686B5|nr:hypothetical protein [Paenibacillus terrae]
MQKKDLPTFKVRSLCFLNSSLFQSRSRLFIARPPWPVGTGLPGISAFLPVPPFFDLLNVFTSLFLP